MEATKEEKEEIAIKGDKTSQNITYNPEFTDHIKSAAELKSLNMFHLKSDIHNCHACPLREFHKPLTYANMFEASLMIIGEYPKDVDFETPQGKVLAKALVSYNVNLDEVYFTSVVKCTDSDQYDTCQHFLVSEMTVVKPLVVVALGYHAAASVMLNGSTVTINPGDTSTLFTGSDMIVTNKIQDVLGDLEKQQEFLQQVQLGLSQLQNRKLQTGGYQHA